MKYVLSSKQSRQLDLDTTESTDLREKDLIDNAGKAIAHHLINNIEDPFNKKFLFISGFGKNGLDAIVGNHYMTYYGLDSYLYLIDKKKINNGYIEYIQDVKILDNLKSIDTFNFIVEGIFGNGLNRNLEDDVLEVIQKINRFNDVISIDIPTGILVDSGMSVNASVAAKATITFGYPKLGHFLSCGYKQTGKLFVYDIGQRYSNSAIDQPRSYLIDNYRYNSDFSAVLDNKYTRGKVLVIGGALKYSGATLLAAESAISCGSGIVKIMYDSKLLSAMTRLKESVDIPIKAKGNELSLKDYSSIKEHLVFPDCLLIGPGLANSKDSIDLTKRILSDYTGYCVIDAGGLEAIDYKNDKFNLTPQYSVLTPHYAELAKLINIDIEEVRGNTIEILKAVSKYLDDRIIVLKGPNTIVADGQGCMWFIVNGDNKLATAGTGDVLCGVVASHLSKANKNSSTDRKNAVINAVYLHAECSNYINKRHILASDIINVLGDVQTRLIEKNET